MASYEGIVPGKLKLKGKALPDGIRKKKRPRRREYVPPAVTNEEEQPASGETNSERIISEEEEEERRQPVVEDHRTAAEKRYEEQKVNLEMKRLTKTANKSHRQRVEEFNQYLANLSEHYDIPKVGPG